MMNHALYFTAPNQVNIIEEAMPVPQKDEVLIKNSWSAISAGTEMLFFNGLISDDLQLDSSIPSLKHKINYPFKYGYCAVGKIIEVGSKQLKHLIDKWVFAFNPHESYFCIKQDQVIQLPDHLSAKKALFIPSMETAINLILDGNPLIGEKVIVLGLGIIGLFTASLLKQFPLTILAGCDLYPKRRELCLTLGANLILDTGQENLGEMDLVYELTGNPNCLNTAIDYLGHEGRIVLGSWYGRKQCNIDLGGKFHRNRIKIISSQVSTIASKLHGRWNRARRLALVFKMLEKIEPARFISHEFPFAQASRAYQLLLNKPDNCLQVTFTYEE